MPFSSGFICTGPRDAETGENPGYEVRCPDPLTHVYGYLTTGYISCLDADLFPCAGPLHYGCLPGETGGSGNSKITHIKLTEKHIFCFRQ